MWRWDKGHVTEYGGGIRDMMECGGGIRGMPECGGGIRITKEH